MKSRFNTLKLISSIILDALFIYLAYYFSFWLRTNVPIPFTDALLPQERFGGIRHYYAILIGAHIALFYFFGIYDRRWRKYFWDTLKYLFIPCILGSFILIAVYFFKGNIFFPRSIFIIFPFLAMMFLNLWRNLLVFFSSPGTSRIIIVGVNPESLHLIETLKAHYKDLVEIVGVIAFSDEELSEYSKEVSGLNVKVLGKINEIKRIIKHTDFNELIFTPENSLLDRYINDISRGLRNSVSMYALPSSFEILLGKLGHTIVHDIPMVQIKNPSTMDVRILKRTVDIILSIVLLILFSPLLLIGAICVKISSPGSIIYKQERIGRGGKTFTIYKFRSMVEGAEQNGAQLAKIGDERITAIGKFLRSTRLDELPQLINILIGNMSFVGPRPERKDFIRDFIRDISGYRERFRVKPGVTGLAQIRGGYHTDARIKLKYDLAYISNYSIWLDFKILLETVKVVLTRRGA